MIFLLIFVLGMNCGPSSLLLKKTTAVAHEIHQKCLKVIPSTVVHQGPLQSLLCGQKLQDSSLEKYLLQSSLIHLFVISGSHLILIDAFFSRMALPFFLRFSLLVFYSLAAGWEAPVVRALLHLALRRFHTWRAWPLPSDLGVLMAGLGTLALFPSWGDSLSLLLSWGASLALCGPDFFRIRAPYQRLLLMQLCIFVFLFPMLWGFGHLHPLGLLFNIFLAPVIAFVLLPLGLAVVVWPTLGPLFDFVLQSFTQILQWTAEPVLSPQGATLPRPLLWLWLTALHLGFYFGRLHLRQGKDFSR